MSVKSDWLTVVASDNAYGRWNCRTWKWKRKLVNVYDGSQKLLANSVTLINYPALLIIVFCVKWLCNRPYVIKHTLGLRGKRCAYACGEVTKITGKVNGIINRLSTFALHRDHIACPACCRTDWSLVISRPAICCVIFTSAFSANQT